MADDYNVYKKCLNCDGSGVITINDETYDPGPPEDVPCPDCAGEGQIFWGVIVEQEEE